MAESNAGGAHNPRRAMSPWVWVAIVAVLAGAAIIIALLVTNSGKVRFSSEGSGQPNSGPIALNNGNPEPSSGAGGGCANGSRLRMKIGGESVETCGRPSLGTVSAINASSITVNDSNTGQTTKFTIAADTKISEQGASKTAADIANGTTVVVIPSTSDASRAGYILINPSMRAPGM